MTAPVVDPGLTQPPTTSSSPPPGTVSPPEYRYGETAPTYLRGKTADEAAHLLEQAVTVIQTFATQATPPAPAPQPQAAPTVDPDAYISGRDLTAMAPQFVQQAVSQAQAMVNPALELAASGNLDRIRQKYEREFAKYGPSIYGALAHVPKQTWTIDNLERVVKFALVDHIDELASERAGQLAASQDPALRATGATATQIPSPQAGPDAALTDAQKAFLRSRGITPEMVAREAPKLGWTPQQWYEAHAKHSVGDAL